MSTSTQKEYDLDYTVAELANYWLTEYGEMPDLWELSQETQLTETPLTEQQVEQSLRRMKRKTSANYPRLLQLPS